MNILLYVLKRIAYILPVFFLLTIMVFAMVHLLPGDPADILLSGEGGAGDPVVREALMKELGLDKPLPVQYFVWLKRALGEISEKSVYSEEDVLKLFMQRFPATLLLAFAAMIVSLVVAIPAGIISAVKRNKLPDYISMLFALFGVSLPNFGSGFS